MRCLPGQLVCLGWYVQACMVRLVCSGFYVQVGMSKLVCSYWYAQADMPMLVSGMPWQLSMSRHLSTGPLQGDHVCVGSQGQGHVTS